MNEDCKNGLPARQMSGRRSKPSIDLLVDNQRILSSNNMPKKSPSVSTKKHQFIKKTKSNQAETALKIKLRRESLRVQNPLECPEIFNNQTLTSSKITNYKSDDANQISINGCEVRLKSLTFSQINDNILSNLPYVTLKLNKIDIPDSLLSSEMSIDTEAENDDIPLSKDLGAAAADKSDQTTITAKKKPRTKTAAIKKVNTPLSPKITNGDTVKSPLSPTKKAKVKRSRDSHNGKQSASDTESVVVPLNVDTKMLPSPESLSSETEKGPRCIGEMCTNVAVDDFRWDKEFCCADCAIRYSKTLFGAWLVDRRARHQVQI